MKDKNKRAEEILTYPTPYKTCGFEKVIMEHKMHRSETTLPTKGSRNSAGYDLYSKDDVIIAPGETHTFWTDVKSYMLDNQVLQIYVRSSIGIKKGLILANGTGIIDSDYFSNESNDGNIGVCLRNIGTEEQQIKIGDRIAQGIFLKFYLADDIVSDEERKGGIGSTNE